jgi:hypothetical protein
MDTPSINPLDQIQVHSERIALELSELLSQVKCEMENISNITQKSSEFVNSAVQGLHQTTTQLMDSYISWMSQMDDFCDQLSNLQPILDQFSKLRQGLQKLDSMLS